AMEDAVQMGMMHRAGDGGQQASGSSAVTLEARQLAIETASVDELHREVWPAVMLTDFVDRHDVRMIQLCDRLRLEAEPLPLDRRGLAAAADHLERDDAVETFLPRVVDHAHAALADGAQQLVIAELAQFGRGRKERQNRG